MLRRLADQRWLVYDDMMDRGEIGLEDCMKLQFALVHERPESIIAYLDRYVEARPGLSGFLHSIVKREGTYASCPRDWISSSNIS